MKIKIVASLIIIGYSANASADAYIDHFGGVVGSIKHLQGSINDDRKFMDHLQGSINDDRKRITANEQWNDRQEGVIRQNRGRLDEHDQQIGFIQEAQTVTDARSIDNDKRHDVATSERGRIESESVQRDNALSQQAQANMNWSIEQLNRQSQAISGLQAGVESNRQAIASERAERKEMGKDLEAGIASAIASGSHMMDVSYQGLQMSIAGGAYRGASAASIAVGGAVSDSTFMHINVSHDSRGNQSVGGNVNFKF